MDYGFWACCMDHADNAFMAQDMKADVDILKVQD